MFNCKTHGWTHLLNQCPACQTIRTTTGTTNVPYTSTTMPHHNDSVSATFNYGCLDCQVKDQRIEHLHEKLRKIREATE